MSVTRNDVDHIAALARLSFTDEEKERLIHELTEILAYMEQLNALNTDAVEPLSHVIELRNAFREDKPGECLTREEALRNAPGRTEQFFKVPKVIGDR